MNNQILNVFAVYRTDDNGFPLKLKGVYCTAELAAVASKGIGAWGSAGPIQQRVAVCVDGKCFLVEQEIDLDDMKSKEIERMKQAALNKLTHEERALLGL